MRADIERVAEAIAPAPRGRIHTFISTSPLHMKYKLQLEPDQVYERIVDSVSYARRFTDDVEWSCEDGSRSDHDFLCRCVEAAIDAGAGTINIPDTVGYAVPDEFAGLIAMLRERVPNIDKAIISVHCHNDLGLAVANSLAAVAAGARQVECTINGLGERAGNAAMEEIVMALRTRHDRMPFHTGVKTETIMRASRLVSAITGFVVQPNKAIVGANAFAHEFGIHQDGMLKHAGTYEIMTPGIGRAVQVEAGPGQALRPPRLPREAARAELRARRQRAGGRVPSLQGPRRPQEGRLRRGHRRPGRRRAGARARPHQARLARGRVRHAQGARAARRSRSTASTRSCEDDGDGPVDSAFNCIKRLFETDARLKLYQVHAVTGGTDAQAEVTVRLEEARPDGQRPGRGHRYARRLRQGLSERA